MLRKINFAIAGCIFVYILSCACYVACEMRTYANYLASLQTVKNVAQDKDCPGNHSMETVSAIFTPVEAQYALQAALETDSAVEVPVVTESRAVQSECSEIFLAAPVANVCTNKDDAVPLSIPATSSAATPCEHASVAILRARHRSVGNITPRGPFDLTGECSPCGDSSSSPSGQSSSKSKRVSRGFKEVTPRMDLPKPPWKAIVKRQMKGSKLKHILVAELSKESSPLAEYVQSQMENQNRDPESGSGVAKGKDANSTCSPARREYST